MQDDPKNYTEQGFWDKVNTVAKAAGQEVVEKALQLYYAASDSQTPVWAKTLMIASIYFCKIEKVTVAPRKILK